MVCSLSTLKVLLMCQRKMYDTTYRNSAEIYSTIQVVKRDVSGMLDITLHNSSFNNALPLSAQYAQVEPAVQISPSGQQPDWEAQVGPAYQVELSGNNWSDSEIRQMKRTGKIECQTCKERTYQDGSNDPSVSFKTPVHVSPENSAAAVQSHEQEHVVNEQASARNEGRKVVSQSVRVFTAICPECGKSYVSGGETQTTTAAVAKKQQASEPGEQVDMRL